MMNSFSGAAPTSTCSSISRRALSTAVEIDELQRASSSGEKSPAVEKLAFLGAKLLQFRQHTDILQECLSTASVISAQLQEIVARALKQCDAASVVLEKEVKRLHPQTLGRVHVDSLDVFEDLLVAYSRVFIFATQLLTGSVISLPHQVCAIKF